MSNIMIMPRLAYVEAPAADATSLEKLIGNTPMVGFRRVVEDLAPGGSSWPRPSGTTQVARSRAGQR